MLSLTMALTARMQLLRSGTWRLDVRDAIEHVRHVYLNNRSDAERTNLERLAVVSAYEFGLSERALDRAGLQRLLCDGVVYQSSESFQPTFRFHHPAVGNLVTRALGGVDESAVWTTLARLEPYVVNGVSGRALSKDLSLIHISEPTRPS